MSGTIKEKEILTRRDAMRNANMRHAEILTRLSALSDADKQELKKSFKIEDNTETVEVSENAFKIAIGRCEQLIYHTMNKGATDEEIDRQIKYLQTMIDKLDIKKSYEVLRIKEIREKYGLHPEELKSGKIPM